MANYEVRLVSGSKAWVTAELQSVKATGRMSPRLVLYFQLRTPNERVTA